MDAKICGVSDLDTLNYIDHYTLKKTYKDEYTLESTCE